MPADHSVPQTFRAPVHGGPLEYIAAQGVVLRQARYQFSLLDDLFEEIKEHDSYRYILLELDALHAKFTRTVREYETEHADWGSNTKRFVSTLAEQNRTIHHHIAMVQRRKDTWSLWDTIFPDDGVLDMIPHDATFQQPLVNRSDSLAESITAFHSVRNSFIDITHTLSNTRVALRAIWASHRGAILLGAKVKMQIVDENLQISAVVIREALGYLRDKTTKSEDERALVLETLATLGSEGHAEGLWGEKRVAVMLYLQASVLHGIKELIGLRR